MLAVLQAGDLEVEGRLVEASNVVLRVWACRGESRIPAVYKPTRGERPLWDFPEGTLAHREVAAYLVSSAMGLGCVPVTVLRDGPFGEGSVQQWVGPLEPVTSGDLVRIDPPNAVPDGYVPVLAAEDTDGDPLVVSHSSDAQLRGIALLDALLGNADRKGSALIRDEDHIWAIDNGLSFHVDDKLRTVLWGFAGESLTVSERDAVTRVEEALDGSLRSSLAALLDPDEIEALAARAHALATTRTFPQVPDDRHPLPWPLW